MIRSLVLENYRSFRHFELHDLGQVNLIVGTNNSGKTSVLEAVHILEAPEDFGPIWSTLARRGEDYEDRDSERNGWQVAIRRLFHGHEVALGSHLGIDAETDRGQDRFSAIIAKPGPENQNNQLPPSASLEVDVEEGLLAPKYSMILRWQNSHVKGEVSALINLTRQGGVASSAVRFLKRGAVVQRLPIRFITAASLFPDTVVELFEDIVLTPSEDYVLDALRIIEPSIERIATSGTERRRPLSIRNGLRGGLLVKCQGIRDRIPIGSMGDGIWRILGLALALAKTEGGILLVDEIDTGLHYSVMEKMWKLVHHTARQLNTQVFATTHSRDCYESLAAISRETVSKHSEITIQRLERGKERSIAYSEQEIIAAARRHLEVR